MKFVVIQVAGLADEPAADLGGKTPLDHAPTPHLDHMAAKGICGLTRTAPHGFAPSGEVGTLAVLGYDPAHYPVPRAVLEAAGLGVELGPDDVAVSLSLVTLESADGVDVMRDPAGGHPPAAEARAIVDDLARELTRGRIEFYAGRGYRHLIVWRGGSASMRTISPQLLVGKPVGKALPEGPGADTLRDVMERGRAVLAGHPVCRARVGRGERAPTAIWLWGQGRRTTLPSLTERFSVRGTAVAGVDLAGGAARLAGLRRIAVPGATGSLDSDLGAKASAALRTLDEVDLLYLHVAAPDEAGHMGDPTRKSEAIAAVDAAVVGPVLDALRQRGEEWRVLVASDHPTPCTTRAHSSDPVPFLVYVAADEAKPRSLSRGFNERDARELGIFIPEGHTLIERLLRH